MAQERLCDEHRELAQTGSCYVILRGREAQRREVRERLPREHGLCGLHKPKQAAADNVGIRSRMIRLYPTQAQRDVLKQWFGVARKTYNATVCLFRGHRRVKRSLAEARIPIERRLYKKQYVAAVPYQLRDNAIKGLRHGEYRGH